MSEYATLDRRKLTADVQLIAGKLQTMESLWETLHDKVLVGSFEEQRQALHALRELIAITANDVDDLLVMVRP